MAGDSGESGSADALVDQLENARGAGLGDEGKARGYELSSVGKDSVEVVLREQNDREVALQVLVLVDREGNLTGSDCVEDLRARAKCAVGDPTDEVFGL